MLLEELSNAPGVSGDEAQARDLIIGAIRDRIDEYRVDSMGNLIACKRASRRASRSKLRVVIAAHMDEVGLIINHVDSDGRLRFERVGAIDPRVLPGQVMLIGANRVPGVIGLKPVHLTSAAEREQALKADDLTLDIGTASKDEALQAVKPGDYASFATRFSTVGEDRFCGKAFDDRAGCAAATELLAEDYGFDLYAVFSVQEEIGSRGARAAAFSVKPDVALVLEATVCDEAPTTRDVSPTTRLGLGPAITIADRRTISDKRLVNLMVETARENNIPFQIKQPLVGSTDASAYHLAGEGVPSISVSVPTRYLHAPISMLSRVDFENQVHLVKKALFNLNRGFPPK